MPEVLDRATFLRLDELTHVEKPLLAQLSEMPGLHWQTIALKMGPEQTPQQTGRVDFTQVIMPGELHDALQRINPWMDENQVFAAVAEITSFETDDLIKNNQRVLELLRKGSVVPKETDAGLQNEHFDFIDFAHPERNSFVAVSQFKIRILGSERHIYPDIICFINGLPVAVIECKSPRAPEPIPSAIDQLMRYAEQRDYVKEGSKQLFYYNQFIVATSRNRAKFGTITTTIEKHFYRWTDPFPFDLKKLEDYVSPQKDYFVDPKNPDDEEPPETRRTVPNDQQRLAHGMLSPENLLSIIRSFSLWTTTDKGQLIKVVGRYQQFRAVKKTVERLLKGTNRDERGGIIWHTQGSGKSLTMVFLIREMWLHAQLQSYKIVLLTDRKQLDEQITTTAESSGFTVNDPKNINDLKTALRSNASEIVSAMIHKFQERDFQTAFPELNPSQKILVLTDEAHRSQYSLLGANLDKALPHATRIAFTGTPIDRTVHTFGDYIDKYTMRQSIEDGVTLAIVYEGRTHDAAVTDAKGAEKKFEDVFADYNLAERTEMLAYGARRAYLEAEETIRDKSLDMLRHYTTHILPNGYKAQVVAVSKDAAHRYRLAFESAIPQIVDELKLKDPADPMIAALGSLKIAAVMSDVDHNEKPDLKQYNDSRARRSAISGFKLPFGKAEQSSDAGDLISDGNIGILVVVDMLLTGFDAPIEQVMYLDKVVVNHNLLQAIARVNRVYDDNKHVGFVVDYVGMGNHLKKALDAYWEKEQQEVTDGLMDSSELIAELENAHTELKQVFESNGLGIYSEADDIFNLFYDEETRHNYMQAFERFAKALDNLYPRKEALDYLNDLNRFADINVQAREHLRDSRISMKGVSDKLRKITDEYLKSQGIEVKVEPISILDERFFENVKKRTRIKTKAAEIEHAIRHYLEVNIDEDPELYATFAEELQRILLAFKENWNEIYRQLEELRERIKASQSENTHGLDRRTQMPVFRKLHSLVYEKKELSDDEISNVISWTKDIYGMLKVELGHVGFWNDAAAMNRLRGEISNYIALNCRTIPFGFSNHLKIASDILAWSNDDRIATAINAAND
jgi:type I restriction enzyme R subunit